jgi:hypothetical protein
LKFKLGIQASPGTVQKYFNGGGPRRQPDPKQRWLTFVRNGAIAQGKFHLRAFRRDLAPRMPGLSDPNQRTPSENDNQKQWHSTTIRGGRHSSLGPGIPEPNQDGVPASDHRHKLPVGYRLVTTSLIGGLHHEYLLNEAAQRGFSFLRTTALLFVVGTARFEMAGGEPIVTPDRSTEVKKFPSGRSSDVF